MKRALGAAWLAILGAGVGAAPPSAVQASEREADAAVALLPGDPRQALTKARQALALTADFEPTAFVRAGRKGEVVEDAYVAARESYRAHRAKLYEAVGLALAASGDGTAALRYLRRAVDLDPRPERTTGLARTLIAQGRGREALLVLDRVLGPEALGSDTAALLQQGVDLAGLPSAQAEVDRARLRTVSGALYRDGPFDLPSGLRLSTSPLFRLTDAPVNVFYAAEASCRSCSSDLADLKRLVPAPARILLVPENLETDRALRQVVDLYRYGWPLLLGKGLVPALSLEPRMLLVVARDGWVGAALKAPWGSRCPPPWRFSGDATFPRPCPVPSGTTSRPSAVPPVSCPPCCPRGWLRERTRRRRLTSRRRWPRIGPAASRRLCAASRRWRLGVTGSSCPPRPA